MKKFRIIIFLFCSLPMILAFQNCSGKMESAFENSSQNQDSNNTESSPESDTQSPEDQDSNPAEPDPEDNSTTPVYASCGTVPHGQTQTRVRYAEATVPLGATCQVGNQVRTCNDGVFGDWSIDFSYPTCMVQGTPPPTSQVNNLRMYVFGHSLLVHEHTPNPTEEKKVPHWIKRLANQAGFQYTADGQYGFLRQHANFSNISPAWGFEQVPSTWNNENTPFGQVDFNVIISTPANFVQYQPASANYYDSNSVSPLSATLSLIDQTRAAHPNIPFYIYENWPDMGSYGEFPGSVDFARYNNDTISGNFHQWFLNYHDSILSARPGSNIKMIPTGPILSRLFRDTMLRDIQLTDLYEDNAPHGQPTLYFLASLVTYMSIYQTPAPANFSIPSTVHPLVRNNYSFIVNYIWTQLQNFNHTSGQSRVF